MYIVYPSLSLDNHKTLVSERLIAPRLLSACRNFDRKRTLPRGTPSSPPSLVEWAVGGNMAGRAKSFSRNAVTPDPS